MRPTIPPPSMLRTVPSFGFSGAGFLTCYHFGVAECLQRHGLLGTRTSSTNLPRMTGVSGGALVASAVAMGIHPQDGMQAVMKVAETTRKSTGVLDHLTPGYSLIDQIAHEIRKLTKSVDDEFVLKRIGQGRLVLGLTDRRAFPNFRTNPNAYVYVDQYESLEEVLSVCLLSSYIPGVTGYLKPTATTNSTAIPKAYEQLKQMIQRGAVKNVRGQPIASAELSRKFPVRIPLLDDNDDPIWYVDGGLANVFPVLDMHTCLVTPFTVTTQRPNQVISPSGRFPFPQRPSEQARLALSVDNLRTIRCIAFSSDPSVLEGWFEQGYNDANHFVHQRSSDKTSTTTTTTTTTTIAEPTPPKLPLLQEDSFIGIL